MNFGVIAALILAGFGRLSAEWNPQSAAGYLDGRQKAWFSWRAAQREDGPCLSCHTGLSYLLARPALRAALGDKSATEYETGLLTAIRKRVAVTDPAAFSPRAKEPAASEHLGVEAVLSALLLAMEDKGRGSLSVEAGQALDRMWALQVQSGEQKGAWHWNSLDLDPWEQPESAYYGAALAAVAVGVAPEGYQKRPQIRAGREALVSYLKSRQTAQPLHNRLMLAWASLKLDGLLAAKERKAIVAEALKRQQADGGWTLESLGPWREHAKAPPAGGSNAYATALTAFVLGQARAGGSDGGLRRGLDWLRAKQDAQGGYWDATSMNKEYAPDSMPRYFMRDAATAFASMALAGAK